MLNNENNNKKLETKSNEFTRDCNYMEVNFATGDQFRKIATLRSKDGPITTEQANEFYDEAEREAREWWKNHPRESVTIRILEGEDGGQKQIIETTPKKDLICGNFRTRIYDQKGKQIVGEENIRKEIKRREELWEQWKSEGKLEKVDHAIRHTDDGSTVVVYTLLPPVKNVHQNEINDGTTWIPLGIGGKKIESGKENQQIDENKISEESNREENIGENIQKENKTDEGSSKEENVRKENDEGREIVEKIKKNINEWNIRKLNFTLSNGSKGKKDCLVHDSAKVNIKELGDLIYPVEIFDESERKELSEVLENDSLLTNFISSGKIERDSLNKNNYHSISVSNGSKSDNIQQTQTDKGKNVLIVFGVISVLLIVGLTIAKSRFSKKMKIKNKKK